ncbi:hypothetical protein J3R82DRAFT_5152 [Butyriboletus roseoflavus]|nr:hypothetical protein J3R82DRAFT_5152 [Butyriboletus roseoflavus]
MSSSSDLETSIAQQIIRKKTKSTKKGSKPSTVAAADHGRNEGDDPHWAYEPPGGAVLLDHTVDVREFEWDAIKDDEDTEIWLIRAPDSIKAKHLNGLEIDPPLSQTARVGSLTRKTTSYDVWSIGDDDAEVAGGEELRGLSCLLPRKRKKGKLYIAPKLVSHHIVISAQPPIATAPEHQPVVYQNTPRAYYPKDMLKHSFVPYGARSEQSRSGDMSIDVDDGETAVGKPPDMEPSPKEKLTKSKESKGKKRKVEGELPKKSKKHKANA